MQLTKDYHDDAEFKAAHDEVRKRLGVQPVSTKIRRQGLKKGSDLPSFNLGAPSSGAYDVDSILHVDEDSELNGPIHEESAEMTFESRETPESTHRRAASRHEPVSLDRYVSSVVNVYMDNV